MAGKIGGPGNFGAVKAAGGAAAGLSMLSGVSGLAGKGGTTAPVTNRPAAKASSVSRAPAAAAPQAPAQQRSSGASAGGSLGTSATGTIAPMAAPEPAAPVQLGEDEWRAQDSSYLGEESGLKLALDQALAGLRDQRVNYNTEFGGGLRNLGYNWQDANGDGLPDDDEVASGSWDRNNMQGAYGQAYKNQQDDFVSRGLMDSSFYADAGVELDRGFNRQMTDMSTARANALKGYGTEEVNARDNHAQSIARAQAEASNRRSLAYGI